MAGRSGCLPLRAAATAAEEDGAGAGAALPFGAVAALPDTTRVGRPAARFGAPATGLAGGRDGPLAGGGTMAS